MTTSDGGTGDGEECRYYNLSTFGSYTVQERMNAVTGFTNENKSSC